MRSNASLEPTKYQRDRSFGGTASRFSVFRAIVSVSFLAALVNLLFFLAPMRSDAQQLNTKIAGPYFHEESNSYYELHGLRPSSRNQWSRAHEEATAKVYKNIRGHLAIIDTLDVHRFITHKFDLPGATWFGLRYFCGPKKLLWVNGRVHKPGQFAFWDRQWAGNPEISCIKQPSMAYMGGYYIGKGNWRWRVQGIDKAYNYFIVQYRVRE